VSWGDIEWDAFCALLEEGWPGEFAEDARVAWRVLLDDVQPVAGVQALKRLLLAGIRFRPSAAELLAEVHHDPSKPTWEEAWTLIQRAIRRHRTDQALLAALDEHHASLRAFVERYGPQRLRTLPVGDPVWGEQRLRELREAWDRHMDASETRQVAALAAGTGHDGLRRLDPLAAIPKPERPAIEQAA
jgi:hypothetical protein